MPDLRHPRSMRITAKRPISGAFAMLFACIAVALSCLVIAPAQADAKSYACPDVQITAQAQSDGSLHVVEYRVFEFDGDFSAIWWQFAGLPEKAYVNVSSMRMARVDDAGNVVGEWTALGEETFKASWRDSGGPAGDAWSFDRTENTVYAFFSAVDERVVFEFDYTVVNGVAAYADVAEIYWKYIPEGWSVDSENVALTIELPVPGDVEVVPGGNVRAWGHGPLDGTVTLGDDGTVAYTVPLVRSGQYAEARVIFPIAWLTNLSDRSRAIHAGVLREQTVLAEEKAWADEANSKRIAALTLVIGSVAVCVAVIAIALLLFLRFGREHKPDFTGDYWRDIPARDIHPAVIGRLWRWDRESAADFTATMMHLAHIGAVSIRKGSYPGPRGKQVDDYYLVRNEEAASRLTDAVDKQAMHVLFDVIAGGQSSLWLGTIRAYGKKHPQRYADVMGAWQGVVSGETNKRDFFEFRSMRLRSLLAGAAVLMFFGAIFAFMYFENFIPVIAMVATALVLALIANYMPRRTVEGNNIVARCKALRNWLRDFSSLDERPPTDVKVWGEFMVYAYQFGVAEQAIQELRKKVPELFEQDETAFGDSYVPWHVWYSSGHGVTGSSMPSVGDMFETSVANTLQTAQAAISAANSKMSGAGGGGGGFSIGGGGGFGGGGGAR